ncbi:MAG: hypothetical protein ABSC50_06945 [Candidatus Bathyarchaeia archaeon]
MTEKFTERTAGIWVPLVFYVVGGAYMLAFWAMFDRAAYHLLVLGGISIVIAAALYFLSKWAYWLGLFSFPLMFALFAWALIFSVDVVGWYPNIPNAVLNASMVLYLVFLTLSFLLLIDRRNTFKSDRILDMLHKPLAAPSTEKQTQP